MPMSASYEDVRAGKKDNAQPRFAKSLWLRLIEMWILTVLVIFFVIRVLGSHTAQRILDSLHHSRLS